MIRLRDGLWRVERGDVCAGFIVHQGEVIACAPYLRKRLDYWATIAEWVEEAEPLHWDIGPHGPQRWSANRCRELQPHLCWCCETDHGFLLGSEGGNGPRIYICTLCGAESRRY